MSLDVYLHMVGQMQTKEKGSGIWIRKNGSTVEISREEWDELHPGEEPVVAPTEDVTTDEVYAANITHNLNEMADKAGIYYHLWRPEEVNITKAHQLIDPLERALEELKARKEYYKQFDSDNGWGTYEQFVPFVQKYLEACKAWPEADVSVWR
jgi:hypothetical protein